MPFIFLLNVVQTYYRIELAPRKILLIEWFHTIRSYSDRNYRQGKLRDLLFQIETSLQKLASHFPATIADSDHSTY